MTYPPPPINPSLEPRNQNAVRYLIAQRRHEFLVQDRVDRAFLSGFGSDQNGPGWAYHPHELIIKDLVRLVEALGTVMAVYAIAREV